MSVLSKLYLMFSLVFFGLAAAYANESLMDRIKGLEPIIGAHPPNIKNTEEFETVKKRYDELKAELDGLLTSNPKDLNLLFMRGYLQSMGHNLDYPGAWQGATDDLKAVLNSNPADIPAMLQLGKLWVDSDTALAPSSEKLFRAAQCNKGLEPLEEAQRGLFFAFYYQGKMRDALRQSEYLKQAWPKNEQYQRLNEMTRTVLSRAGDSKALAPSKVAMVTCNE